MNESAKNRKWGSRDNKFTLPQIDILIQDTQEDVGGGGGNGTYYPRQKPRIPDLSTADKRKILDLVDILAKTNEEKDRYAKQVQQQQGELQELDTTIKRLEQNHENEVEQLHQQINELKSNMSRSNDTKDSELTVFKTQKEIEIKRLVYDYSLKIQGLQMQLKNELQQQKHIHESETLRMQRRIQELENIARKHADSSVDKEKMANAIVKELEKDKLELEEKLMNYKRKLKAAVCAIQKLKSRLDMGQGRKTSHKISQTSPRNGVNNENSANRAAENALISDLFFTNESMCEVVDSVLYPPDQGHLERARILPNDKWIDRHNFF